MRKLIIASLAGIGALTAASVAVVVLLTRDDRPVARPGRVELPPPATPQPTLVPPDYRPGQLLVSPNTGGLTPADFERLTERGPPRVVPPSDSWEAVPVASSRVRGGDPIMAAVGRELIDLHELLSACFEPEVAARQGAATYSPVKPEESMDDAGTTVLLLQLETQTNAVRVVDAPVASSGGASDGTLACVQGLLRGKVFEAPGARAGERRRLQHQLIP